MKKLNYLVTPILICLNLSCDGGYQNVASTQSSSQPASSPASQPSLYFNCRTNMPEACGYDAVLIREGATELFIGRLKENVEPSPDFSETLDSFLDNEPLIIAHDTNNDGKVDVIESRMYDNNPLENSCADICDKVMKALLERK